ncbi:essential MCU regulator, mitochondrial [Podarcis lilfordi]|uniref:Essential MCU regulator, mitochondrial n=1 Tax=Podarcis lilfordi TaxID=74358 RepID=A0AA35PHA5_9SAUR|nr:essential MCU regulator, mitochondrial [Podarcis lilfordi]
MAGRLWAAAGCWARPVGSQRRPSVTAAPSRNVTVTRTGAILPKPVKMPFGLLRVFAIKMMTTTINRVKIGENKSESHRQLF